jgi:hypothetical protein
MHSTDAIFVVGVGVRPQVADTNSLYREGAEKGLRGPGISEAQKLYCVGSLPSSKLSCRTRIQMTEVVAPPKYGQT